MRHIEYKGVLRSIRRRYVLLCEPKWSHLYSRQEVVIVHIPKCKSQGIPKARDVYIWRGIRKTDNEPGQWFYPTDQHGIALKNQASWNQRFLTDSISKEPENMTSEYTMMCKKPADIAIRLHNRYEKVLSRV